MEMRAVEKRRREWLLGRAVAKDAVGRLIARHTGEALEASAIEIVPDGYGCPQVAGEPIGHLGMRPAISIAHSEGTAVALAAFNAAVGIDLESLARRREDFETIAFSRPERDLLEELPAALRQEWALRMWCAKEAAGKASGRGLSAGLLALQISRIDPDTGRVSVVWRGESFHVSTTRDDEFVFAAVIRALPYPDAPMAQPATRRVQ
jgi:phosphopantetheinyl transferase